MNEALGIEFLNASLGGLHTRDGEQFHAFAPKHEKECHCSLNHHENLIWNEVIKYFVSKCKGMFMILSADLFTIVQNFVFLQCP